jgi:hypothetical protein
VDGLAIVHNTADCSDLDHLHPVVLGLIGCLSSLGIIWCPVRYAFVSPRLAQIAVLFVLLNWPTSLGSAIYLFVHRNYLSGAIALLWPLLAGLIGIPGKIGVVELALAEKIGYVDHLGNVMR